MEKQKKTSFLNTISFKIFFSVGLVLIFLTIFYLIYLSQSVMNTEYDMINRRLEADIDSFYDGLIHSDSGEWSIKGGSLYINDILIGDGTIEKANVEPFKHYEKLTGTFGYIFMKTDNDQDLKWEEDGGYQQGHYLRVAGSTVGRKGERLEGTYIDKKVADAIEQSENGIFAGEANVNGRPIYCRYELIKDKSGNIIGIISNGRSVEELESAIASQKRNGLLITILITICVAAVLAFVVSRVLKSVKAIDSRLKTIGEGQYSEKPLELKGKDEFSNIAQSINEMESALIEREKIKAELGEKEHDLRIASSIQSGMLPILKADPENHYDVCASMTPAKSVGGDFYDFFKVNNHTVAIVMADVSGKGLQACLYMAFAKAVINLYALAGNSTDKIAEKTNLFLLSSQKSNLFVTTWIGLLDMQKEILYFTNAGHNPPLIKRKDAKYEFLNSKVNFVLGGKRLVKYAENQIKFKPGDRLFLYTDGVTEAKSVDGQFFTAERLLNTLNDAKEQSVADTVETVKSTVDSFQKDTDQYDDITMLAFDFQQPVVEQEEIFTYFDADKSQFERALQYICNEVKKTKCKENIIRDIEISSSEVIANICSYAYGEVKGQFGVSVKVEDRQICITFVDEGTPFNPLNGETPDCTLGTKERAIGGLGVYIVKKLMNDAEYRFENGKNVLKLKKLF